jgi:hypothetical protein
LVKWVKGNFLAGRAFVDDVDLASQNGEWLCAANARPNAATGEPPNARLRAEMTKGNPLPVTAGDYGFPASAQANSESLVHVAGNTYSVPVAHAGAPLTVRLHRERIVIWRDIVLVADHPRAPDGAHQRVVSPAHFAPLFAKKPRAQTMLEREALLALNGAAVPYIAELSRRRREHLAPEIGAVYALYQQHGQVALLVAMRQAHQAGIYGADYLELLLAAPAGTGAGTLVLAEVPPQAEVDRLLSSYEAWVGADVAWQRPPVLSHRDAPAIGGSNEPVLLAVRR